MWIVQSNKRRSSTIKADPARKNRNDGLSMGLDNCDCLVVVVYLWILLAGVQIVL